MQVKIDLHDVKTNKCGQRAKTETGESSGSLRGYAMCPLLCPQSLGHVRLFVIPWIAAFQAPLSMGILQARLLE